MNDLPADPIGAAWLARTYGVTPMGRMPVLSQIGKRRSTEVKEARRLGCKSQHLALKLGLRFAASQPTGWDFG